MEQIAEVPENSQLDSRKCLRHPARPDVPSSATPALAARLPRVPFCECLNQPTSSLPPAKTSHFVPRPRHGFRPSCSPASSAQAEHPLCPPAPAHRWPQQAGVQPSAMAGHGKRLPSQRCCTPRPGPLPPTLSHVKGAVLGIEAAPLPETVPHK